MSIIRSRWAAIGAAVAITLGAGGIGIVSATQPSDAVAFVPITPCRVMDTRTEYNVGPKNTPLGPGEVYTVNTTTADTGNCTTIPTTATGVSLNITALDATLPTFLTVWETGDAQPEASSLNPVPGQPPTPSAVTTGINSNGQFDIYNLQGNVQVVADINGYYTNHNHDDRYYTKNQANDRYYTKNQVAASRVVTQSFSPFNMKFPLSSTPADSGNCPTRPSGGTAGVLGLDLPVGAHIDAVSASVFDDGSTSTYVVGLQLYSLKPTILGVTQLASVSGGSSTTVHTTTLDLTPSIDTTINAGDSLRLSFSTPTESNGFCGVTVTYTLPPL